jgi:TPR repeat protein
LEGQIKKAVKWYRKDAEQGQLSAQRKTGGYCLKKDSEVYDRKILRFFESGQENPDEKVRLGQDVIVSLNGKPCRMPAAEALLIQEEEGGRYNVEPSSG